MVNTFAIDFVDKSVFGTDESKVPIDNKNRKNVHGNNYRI